MTTGLRNFELPNMSTFGFGIDELFDEIVRIKSHQTSNYPPFNIIKQNDNRFVIEIAVAGFNHGDVVITVKDRELIIDGKRSDSDINSNLEYVFRGISGRDFHRVFWIHEYIQVIEAKQENGILSIELERVIPEEKRSKVVPIKYTV